MTANGNKKGSAVFFIIILITCLSGTAFGTESERITDIYNCDKGICFDTETNTHNILVKDDFSDPGFLLDYNLMDISKDKKWVILSLIIGQGAEKGDITIFNELLYIPKKQYVPANILGADPMSFQTVENTESVELFYANNIFLYDLEKQANHFIDCNTRTKELKNIYDL